MADASTTQIRIYTEEELKTWAFTRLRYLAIKYGADPTKTMKIEELLKFVLDRQKKTGGKIQTQQVMPKASTTAASKKTADEPEPDGDEAPVTKAAAKPATKAASATKRAPAPDDDDEPTPPTTRRHAPIDDDEPALPEDDDEPTPPPASKKSGKGGPAPAPAEDDDDVPRAAVGEDDEPEPEPEPEEVPESVTDEGGAGLTEMVEAVGHTLDELMAAVNTLTEKVEQMEEGLTGKADILREKAFIQSGMLRMALIKSGMGKEDVKKLMVSLKEDWVSKTTTKA